MSAVIFNIETYERHKPDRPSRPCSRIGAETTNEQIFAYFKAMQRDGFVLIVGDEMGKMPWGYFFKHPVDNEQQRQEMLASLINDIEQYDKSIIGVMDLLKPYSVLVGMPAQDQKGYISNIGNYFHIEYFRPEPTETAGPQNAILLSFTLR